MTPKVLVVVDAPGSAGPVTRAAAAVAALLGGHVEAVPGRPAEELLSRAGAADVRVVAVPLERKEPGARVEELLSRCPVPLLVVPERAAVAGAVARVLVPLEGTPESAAAVAQALELFAASGADIVVLHVFDAATVPRFWDQPAHARRSWEEEFLARYCPHPGARLTLRRGAPGENVVDVAAAERPDLIVLGWSQRLSAGRARTVRATLAQAAAPVLLVPVGVPVAAGRTGSPSGG